VLQFFSRHSCACLLALEIFCKLICVVVTLHLDRTHFKKSNFGVGLLDFFKLSESLQTQDWERLQKCLGWWWISHYLRILSACLFSVYVIPLPQNTKLMRLDVRHALKLPSHKKTPSHEECIQMSDCYKEILQGLYIAFKQEICFKQCNLKHIDAFPIK
jgi:hypothetical protein